MFIIHHRFFVEILPITPISIPVQARSCRHLPLQYPYKQVKSTIQHGHFAITVKKDDASLCRITTGREKVFSPNVNISYCRDRPFGRLFGWSALCIGFVWPLYFLPHRTDGRFAMPILFNNQSELGSHRRIVLAESIDPNRSVFSTSYSRIRRSDHANYFFCL